LTVSVGLKKFAVMLFGPLIVRSFGLSVPLKAPLQFTQPQPEFAVALQETTVPASYQLPDAGVTEPLPVGLTAVVN
jgi:hypothetical protein